VSARPRHAGGLPVLLLRAAPARAVALAVLVVLAAASIALVPAWFSDRTAAGLPALLATAGQGRLGLEFGQGGRIDPGATGPMAGVAAAGDAITATLPGSVAAIASPRTDLVDTPEYNAIDAPVPITRVVMRFQPDATALTRYVDGRAPTGTVTEHQIGSLHDQDGNPMVGRNLEVAVSRETANELGLHVGDHLSLIPATNIQGVGLVINVTGIFEALDAADPRWFDDHTLLSPVEVRASAEVTIYHMVALLSPDAYPVFVPSNGSVAGSAGQGPLVQGGVGSPVLRYRWRFPVDAASSAAWDADALSADLARLAVAYPDHGSLSGSPGLSTGLGRLIDGFLAQRSVATTSFSLAAAGPLAAVAGILALAAMAVADRRRVTLRLLRSRGTPSGRLLIAEAIAGGVLAVPAAVLGAVLAVGVRRGDAGLAVPGAAAVAVVAVMLLLVAGLGSLRGPAGARPTRRGRRLLSPGRSRVLTGLVVVVAVAAAVGLRTAAPSSGAAGSDLGATLVPVLLGIAGGVVLTRAFGLATRGIAVAAARTRGFAVVHALRGLARDAGARDLPFVVLTVAVTAGIFASVIAGSITRSQGVAAAGTVGADWRIAATSVGGFPTGLDTAGLATIGPTAVVGQTGASLASRTLASVFVSVSVVNPAAYARVVEGTLVDGQLAAALEAAAAASSDAGAGPTGTASGTPTVGLVLRSTFASRLGLAPGASVTFTVAGQPTTGIVSAVLNDLPGLPAGSDVAVANESLGPVAAASAVPVTVLLAGPDPAPIDRVIAPYRAQMTVTSRDAMLRTLTDTPLADAMRDGFTLMLVLSSALAGAVVAASLLAALGGRVREAALLRTLGVGELAARRIVVGEAALTVLVALGTGLVLGLGIAWLTVPNLGIERMAGVAGPVVPVADPVGVAAAVAGPVVVGLLALAAGILATRGRSASVRLLAEEA